MDKHAREWVSIIGQDVPEKLIQQQFLTEQEWDDMAEQVR
jgi:hypothetical protein